MLGSGDDLFAIDVNTQQVLWKKETGAGLDWWPFAYLMVAGDFVYIVGEFVREDRSALIVYNRFTGTEHYSMSLDDITFSPQLLVGNNLIFPNRNSLQAFDLSTWQMVWETEFNGENDFYGTGPLAAAGNVVAFNSGIDTTGNNEPDSRVLVGVDASTGSILWSHDGGDGDGARFEPQSDGTTFYSAVSELNFVAGFRTNKGYPFAVDAATGNIRWQSSNHTNGNPTVAAGQLFFPVLTEVDGAEFYRGFASVDSSNGKVTMRAPGVSTIYVHTPTVVHNNRVYTPDDKVGYIELP